MSERPQLLRWETLTKKQFDRIARAEAVVLLTCSPLEVHGPHLPLGADVFQGDTHGGVIETSQLLALHPEWVDPDFKSLPRRTADIWLDERVIGLHNPIA